METVKVNCYSGHTYAERPQSFQWRGVEHEVKEVVKAWREPVGRCFKVRTGDNKVFQLCYNEAQDFWTALEILEEKP